MNDDFDSPDDLGFITYDEIEGICKRHMESGNDPYDEDEFMDIITWIRNTKVSISLLELVLKGDLDVCFKGDVGIDSDNPEDRLSFKLTEQGREKAKMIQDMVGKSKTDNIINLDFGNTND